MNESHETTSASRALLETGAPKHSPLPWKTGPINYADIYGADGSLAALVPKDENVEGNVALILRSANSHDELLEALNEAPCGCRCSIHDDVTHWDGYPHFTMHNEECERVWCKRCAAIAKATRGSNG